VDPAEVTLCHIAEFQAMRRDLKYNERVAVTATLRMVEGGLCETADETGDIRCWNQQHARINIRLLFGCGERIERQWIVAIDLFKVKVTAPTPHERVARAQRAWNVWSPTADGRCS
jgi:hypothetical protein